MRLSVTLIFLTPLSCLGELEPGEELLAMDCNTMPCGEDATPNQSPTAPELSIVPLKPVNGDTLFCLLTELGLDPEGSSTIYEYGWLKNGQDMGAEGKHITAEGNTGDLYECWAAATDLQGNTGEEGVSSPVSIRDPLAIDETIQAADELEIHRRVTSDYTALVCGFGQASPSHSSEDKVTYSYSWEWSQNDGETWHDFHESTSFLSDSLLTTNPDKLWRCTITSHQGGAVGSSASIPYLP